MMTHGQHKLSAITLCIGLIGCFFSFTAGAASISATVSPAFPALVGGINEAKLKRCTAILDRSCRRDGVGYPPYAANCAAKTLQTPVCTQAQILYQNTGLLAKHPERYQQISVFSVSHYGDGIDSTYIIDNSGRIIMLISQAGLAGVENSSALLRQYPRALISNVTSTPPTYILLPDKTQRLVFLQEILLDGSYAARSTQWQTQVSYAFSKSGDYTGTQVLGIAQNA